MTKTASPTHTLTGSLLIKWQIFVAALMVFLTEQIFAASDREAKSRPEALQQSHQSDAGDGGQERAGHCLHGAAATSVHTAGGQDKDTADSGELGCRHCRLWRVRL